MSINKEKDIFSDIVETPEKKFWEKILNKETQKSPETIIGNCSLKKETKSDNSEDEEIKIVKEVTAIPPDLIIKEKRQKLKCTQEFTVKIQSQI